MTTPDTTSLPPLPPQVEALIPQLIEGKPRALARLITLVERGDGLLPAIMARLTPYVGRAHIVGVTGPPGAGKSTLVNQMVAHLRAAGKKVGILAVDPSSPFTGGALLGDRIRMQQHVLDPGVYLRSLATRGHGGGLSLAVRGAVKVLDAAGMDVVFVETVGVGQTELEIMQVVDTIVVVLVPEAGDAIQALKAGLLEIAHIFVVNKADREGAERFRSDLRNTLALLPSHAGWRPPVLLTKATDGEGVAELLEQVHAHFTATSADGTLEARRREQRREALLAYATAKARQLVEGLLAKNGPLKDLADEVEAGLRDPQSAAEETIARIFSPHAAQS